MCVNVYVWACLSACLSPVVGLYVHVCHAYVYVLSVRVQLWICVNFGLCVWEKKRDWDGQRKHERETGGRDCVCQYLCLCTRARACECRWLCLCVVRTCVSPHTVQPWLCVLIYSTLLVISNGYPSCAWKCTQLFCRKGTWWRCYMLHDDLNARLEIYRTQLTVCWIRRWTKNLQNDRHSHPTFPLL